MFVTPAHKELVSVSPCVCNENDKFCVCHLHMLAHKTYPMIKMHEE